ncbi:MAG: hypothetical protein ACO22T_04900 [Burkholderiales bacterium]
MRANSGFRALQKSEMKRPRSQRGPGKYCCGLLRRLLAATTVAAIAAVTTIPAASAAATFTRTLVEFLATSTAALVFTLALRASAAHLGLLAAAHYAHAAALLWIRSAGAIARSKRDLEFIEFVPLGIRAIAIGDGQQLLHALAR